MEAEAITREIARVIRQFLTEDYKIFLFGSWAKGTAADTSDVDIAIDGPKKIDQDVMIRIKAGLEGIPTLRSMDVVDLNSAGEEFKKNVLEHARLIN